MNDRQYAIISLAKLNRFAKMLTYNLCIKGEINMSQFATEFLEYKNWCYLIYKYVEVVKDVKVLEEVKKLGIPTLLSDYLDESKEVIPRAHHKAITEVVDELNKFRDFYETSNNRLKGKFINLVNFFANEEAASLFDRVVAAGYLTNDYQPTGKTDMNKLKIIAFGIGRVLNLQTRNLWCHFEEQWNLDESHKLARQVLSDVQFKKSAKLRSLFPEVDFNEIMEPKDLYFEAAYGEQRVRKLYYNLWNNGYISQDTKINQFFSIFNIGNSETRVPVEWKTNQNSLVYFVYYALKPTNRDQWAKTSACFRIEGKVLNVGSLKSAMPGLRKQKDFNTHDLVLKRIASEYVNGE